MMDMDEKARMALIEQGAALWEIRDTAGFKALERYLRSRAQDAAIRGLEDEGEGAKPIDYWRGYVQACKDVVEYVDLIVDRANELKDESKAAGREIVGIRLGRSEGALVAEEAG